MATSAAEAISTVNHGLSLVPHVSARWLAAVGLAGVTSVQDKVVWQEYLEAVLKERDGWADLYRACRKVSQRPASRLRHDGSRGAAGHSLG